MKGHLTLWLLAALAWSCGAPVYVDGPALLGPYEPLSSVDSGQIAEHTGRLDRKDATIERGSYADHYTLFGEAGERVWVTMTSSQLDSYVYVIDGAGRIIGEDDDSAGSLNARLEVELPVEAIYLVVATSYSREQGDYVLRVDRGLMAAQYPLIDLPADTQRRFAVAAPLDDSGNPYHVYAFDLLGGSQLEVRMTSGHADTLLRLYDGLGRHVAEDDDSGGNLNSHLVFTPSQSGRYYLVATTFSAPEPLDSASYHLTISQ